MTARRCNKAPVPAPSTWDRCTRAGGSRPHPPALLPVRT